MGKMVAYFSQKEDMIVIDKMTVVNDKISHKLENILFYTIALVTEFELSHHRDKLNKCKLP